LGKWVLGLANPSIMVALTKQLGTMQCDMGNLIGLHKILLALLLDDFILFVLLSIAGFCFVLVVVFVAVIVVAFVCVSFISCLPGIILYIVICCRWYVPGT